jgi:CubicO group peptidase (beta-lactamase class C family)
VQPALASARTQAPVTQHATAECSAVDSAALERFLDARFGEGLKDRLFPGAVFVFVQDGRVVLAKGFGVANVEAGTPVDPERTVFFGGSLSKLVTATAVVQLVDRGLLDLDTDVNRYLTSMQVDSTYADPVTLRHLLTHTGGFDGRDIGMAAYSREDVLPLDAYVRRDLTPRVDPPGTAFRYSNLGMALAGLVVQEVSGRPFAEYVRDSIFVPLGMHRSGIHTPRDDEELTPGYTPLPGRRGWRPARYIYSHNRPAIGLRTTGHDMARFILAHLNGGTLEGQRILSDSAAAMMRASHFAVDPRLEGVGLGFRYSRRMGLLVSGHRGLVNHHASIVDLIPDANAGFFVACSAADCARMESTIDELLETFLCGRDPPPVERPLARSVVSARDLAGTYRPKRQARRSIEKARGLFDEYVLWARGDTLALTANTGSRQPHLLIPVADDEYARVDGRAKLVLVPSASGERALYMSGATFPQEQLVRLSYFETRSFFMRMSLASTGGLASAIVLLPAVFIARRWRGSPGAKGVGMAAAIGGTLLCAVLLAFLTGMQRVLGGAVESEFIFGVPDSVRVLLWLPVAAIVIGLPLPALAVGLWRKRLWTVFERVYFALMLAGAAALLLLLHYWNFVGSRY